LESTAVERNPRVPRPCKLLFVTGIEETYPRVPRPCKLLFVTGRLLIYPMDPRPCIVEVIFAAVAADDR
jgi:hypothetical protein